MKGQKCKHTLTHMYRQINQKDIEEDGDEEDRILVFFFSIHPYVYILVFCYIKSKREK